MANDTLKKVNDCGNACLNYVDSGKFFRQPVKFLYYLLSVVTFGLPIGLFGTMTDMWDWISGKEIFMYILLIIAGLFIAICCCYLWIKRAGSLQLDASENSRFIAIPILANILQTMGEWAFVTVGAGGFIISLIYTIFGESSSEFGAAGIIILPAAGYLSCLFMRFLAESTMALAHIANNTSAINSKLDK